MKTKKFSSLSIILLLLCIISCSHSDDIDQTSIDGICYTFKFYKEVMIRVPDKDVPKISINDIFPDDHTVKSKTYPFISEVHIAIRSDLDRNSMAYKMYEWLQTKGANDVISESGYIPKNLAK